MRLLGPLPGSLAPAPDEARRWLRRELADPGYSDKPLMERFTDWLGDLIGSAATSAGEVSVVAVGAALVLVFGLLVGIALLTSRLRRSGAATSAADLAALPEVRLGADEHRRRAEQLLTAGEVQGAVVEAFRAQVMRLVEAGTVDDVPGATATELTHAMAAARPEVADEVRAGARVFDEVLYGDHPVDAEAVHRMLALDDRLGHRRSGARR